MTNFSCKILGLWQNFLYIPNKLFILSVVFNPQVLGKVPTISIDKTDGCQMYLSKDSLDVEIISSKSSEMNVLLPNEAGDDYVSYSKSICSFQTLLYYNVMWFSLKVELAIPEQFKTVVSGKTLQTSCNESLG